MRVFFFFFFKKKKKTFFFCFQKGALIDIWALGVVLYRLLSGGRPPFYSDVASEVLDAITHARFSSLDHASAEANDLIRKILVVDPNERLSLRGISEHSWMK